MGAFSLDSQKKPELTLKIQGLFEDDIDEWCFAIAFVARLFIYAAVLALLAIVVFMIMRYLENLEDRRIEGEEGGTETNPLLIFNEENKTCPVCRRSIGKIRKLFAS
ncbi:hypothetical protein CFP56_037454 [Quercus suber]|uniref:Uncharacterized protein n=1 Tax=Quercus suber TaxID=58331 RepID=A0AAW0LPQ4_QUESU